MGQLGQAEVTLVAGGGSQLDPSGRWGDYAAMTIDPVDDCTFWFTSEFYRSTAQSSWETQIGAFRFPGCVAA